LLLATLVLAQLVALRSLHYSKAWFTSVSLAEARAPRDPLRLGGLRWDVAPYVNAPSLAPMRALVRARCPGLTAVGTASCLSDLFAERFPHAPPRREFFEAGYSPASDLAAHLEGEPGHCVTRSGLLAATLLAAGFPARVVQLVPPQQEGGHNVAEVWDPASGWVFVDPTYGLLLDGARDQVSAAAALSAPWSAHLRVNAAVRPVARTRPNEAQALYWGGGNLLGGNVVYPDPWLYTRVGRKAAPTPFQGRFVIVGPRTLAVGIGQPLLHAGIALGLLALAVSLLWGLSPAALTATTSERDRAPAIDARTRHLDSPASRRSA
jgi:hypothetical protein